MTATARPGQTLAGIGFLIAAVACFAMLDTAVKVVGAVVSVLLAVWFRYVFQAVAVTAVMLPLRGRALLHTSQPRAQALRGALLLAVSMMSFVSVQFMPVGEFTALVMVTPLATTLLAALFMRERVAPLRWLLVLGGFAGVLMVVQPGSAMFGWASVLPLILVFAYAWFQILTAKMARTENPITMHFYTGWVGAIVASLLLPLVWQSIPDTRTLLLLCFIGLMGTIGHFLLILAFQRAPASRLSPFLYTQIGFAMFCGWWVYGHVPGGLEIAGIALIVACGASASWLTAREHRPPIVLQEA